VQEWPTGNELGLEGSSHLARGAFVYLRRCIGRLGKTSRMAAVALVVPISLRQFREFWTRSSFWITVLLLAIIQVPLVIAVRFPMQQGGPYYSLAFGIGDVLCVGFVILFVCSKSSGKNIRC